jgi:hypothetical protein
MGNYISENLLFGVFINSFIFDLLLPSNEIFGFCVTLNKFTFIDCLEPLLSRAYVDNEILRSTIGLF